MDRTTILIARLKAVGVKIDNDDSYFLKKFAEDKQNPIELEHLQEQMVKAAQEDTSLVEEAYAEFDRAAASV